MKRIIKIAALLALSLMLTAFAAADDSVTASTSEGSPAVTVFIDGEQLMFPDQTPIIVSGRTLVPMRAIFEKLGASIYWDESTRTVISTKNDTSIVIQIDNTLMVINNEHHYLDVAATLVNNRTMVPLRAVSQALGYKVEWDGENYKVDIKTQITE